MAPRTPLLERLAHHEHDIGAISRAREGTRTPGAWPLRAVGHGKAAPGEPHGSSHHHRSVQEVDFFNRACLLRFLEANDYDMDRSLDQIKACATWYLTPTLHSLR